MYHELPPAPDLAPLIACFWEHGARSGPTTVVPDGCFDLLFHHSGGESAASARVLPGYLVGPQMRPIHATSLDGGWRVFGIRFRPGTAQHDDAAGVFRGAQQHLAQGLTASRVPGRVEGALPPAVLGMLLRGEVRETGKKQAGERHASSLVRA